ncbi:MAG: class I SAM-dependent methyltransferase [Sterolibacteriaceae bacterium]|uniref:site-specific DNA-methyltransferase (adenine-specific) n=1 Tax=Candidatus Methylophosphatis roskildensis TaxID=2899263 RepID=A0A9D7E5B2_9PROT|nr:class I SAM-dependent methyltransferase [Candidatus Methylophosphatis roskildensis]MBK7238282.1 class I SAM-dependent methyltransferase [Sterolibacteriaceae bacterium]
MLALRRNKGRTLEPSAGDGAFSRRIRGCVAIEIDPRVAPRDAWLGDFFAYPVSKTFSAIIGNPPYVRYQDIRADTKKLLDCGLFDGRSNLYLFFIEKAVRHLLPGGELIFIVPRDFIKLTAARRLNKFVFDHGTITDFIETGDTRIFTDAVPNCAIFRFEKGRFDRRMHDGRVFSLIDGQLMFLAGRYTVPLGDLFDVRVGAVSGLDEVYTHPNGNAEFVCSQTIDTGKTRRMFFGVKNAHLAKHKDRLLARRIRRFDGTNWWQWGRLHHVSQAPRIYVNQKTRRLKPFFLHPCKDYDGSILALFPKDPGMNIERAVGLLNTAVNWEELGFVCDRRFIFGQRTLQTCLLPSEFQVLRGPHLLGR